jgi:hypothetical protein
MSSAQKVAEALRRSIPKLPGELAQQLKDMLTSPLTWAMIAATIVFCAATGGAGMAVVGWVLGAGFSAVALYQLVSAGAKAVSAQTEQDLEAAAAEFATAIITGGTALLPAVAKVGLRRAGAVKAAAAQWGGAAKAEQRVAAQMDRVAKQMARRNDPAVAAQHAYRVPPTHKVGEVIELPIEQVYSRQNAVTRGAFHSTYNEATGSIPEVYWVDWQPGLNGGKPFWALGEGNHRTAARMWEGHTTIKAKVIFNPEQTATQALFADREYVLFPQNGVWSINDRYLGKVRDFVGKPAQAGAWGE